MNQERVETKQKENNLNEEQLSKIAQGIKDTFASGPFYKIKKAFFPENSPEKILLAFGHFTWPNQFDYRIHDSYNFSSILSKNLKRKTFTVTKNDCNCMATRDFYEQFKIVESIKDDKSHIDISFTYTTCTQKEYYPTQHTIRNNPETIRRIKYFLSNLTFDMSHFVDVKDVARDGFEPSASNL